MWRNLEEAIHLAAKRKIQEHETYMKAIHDENVRRRRRSNGLPSILPVRRPGSWALDPGFNPYLVRSRRCSIAHAMTNQLRRGEFEPRRAASFEVPKPSGGTRTVSTFQIADEVISNRLMRSLLRKNQAKFSSRAYAYRSDLTPHDAIHYLQTEFGREHRIFVAEYDFKKFFETVNHDHIRETMDKLKIVRTPLENELIEAFLTSPHPYETLTGKSTTAMRRSVGVPQGTSISLFLANMAASELDRALERMGVGFVRYADDTLIWSQSYDQICEAVNAIHAASDKIGSPINPEKSLGVRLLVQEGTKYSELSDTQSIEYLGHRLSLRVTRMKATTVQRVKSRISELLFTNLLLEPLSGRQNPGQLTDVDRDYVTFILQTRRYLYGSLTEKQVRKFQSGSITPMSFKGVMSFFPLVNDYEQLRELDDWMVSQTWLTLRKREKLLRAISRTTPFPWGLNKSQLARAEKKRAIGDDLDLRLPSFGRITRAIQLAVETHGLAVVSPGSPLYHYKST